MRLSRIGKTSSLAKIPRRRRLLRRICCAECAEWRCRMNRRSWPGPEDLNAALDQLKGASFVCGGSRPCHHSFAAGDPTELTPQQSRAVWTGTIAFICLCLLVVVIVVIAYAIVQEDKQRCTSHDLQMQVRNSRLKYQHSLAQKELASSAAQEHKLPLVPAVSYVTGPPPMVSGYADVRQMVIPRAASPVYSGRPQAVPYTVSAPPAYSATG